MLNIEDVDMRSVRSDKTVNTADGRTAVRVCLDMLMHPTVPTAIVSIFFSPIVYILAAVYTPIYNDYLAGCVDHTQNGTFLTQNLYR